MKNPAGNPGALRSGVAQLLRYGLASIGPIGAAGCQFLLSLILLKTLNTKDFGAFSFQLIASQLSLGIWSALFCAPLPIILARVSEADGRIAEQSMFTTNLLFSGAAAFVFFALGLAVSDDLVSSALFGAYSALGLMRWFARAYAYARGTPLRTVTSDIIYAVTLLAAIAVIFIEGSSSLPVAFGALLFSTAIGLLPFGKDYFLDQFVRLKAGGLLYYRQVWKEHSRWSLAGVVTTEATANSHAYLVTALLGATAFAPIAASAIIVKPISVAMNALTEFERAKMARQLSAGDLGTVTYSMGMFRLAMMLVWLGVALAVAALFATTPSLVFPESYDLNFIMAASAIWVAIAGVRVFRGPESTFLQASGAFRPLAMASVISSGFSLLTVLVLLVWQGALWSLLGILLGECVFAFCTWVQSRKILGIQKSAGAAAAGLGAARQPVG